MIVKVCGMRDPENIRAVDSLESVNWMGFIFYPKSPRYVGSLPARMPEQARRIGVFVNATADFILERVDEYRLDGIQLHGCETPGFCQALREMLPQGKHRPMIVKAFSIATPADLSAVHAYDGYCDYFLFDTKCTGYGGSGEAFDWDILHRYHDTTPFLLSGGIGPESLGQLALFRHPQWAGIDLNSRFEVRPGVKDTSLLSEFLGNLKIKKATSEMQMATTKC